MRIFAAGVPDDIFAALYVAKNDTGEDLKSQLQYQNGKGITKMEIINKIKEEYVKFQSFQIEAEQYKRYENFFAVNFALVKLNAKDRINFDYKSESWESMIFLRQKNRKVKGIILYNRSIIGFNSVMFV